MKLHASMTINGKHYKKGDEVPGWPVYLFFGFHMLMFGAAGFMIAYAEKSTDVFFLYMHGGIAILAYLVFYLAMFGVDEVKWMFINAGLGILAIYSQIDWLLSLFGKRVDDFPIYVHVIPFLYFILYTFLLHQAVLDLTNSRENENRKRKVEYGYIAVSVAVYLLSGFFLHDNAPADESAHYTRYYTEPAGNLPRSPDGDSSNDSVMAKLKQGDRFWDQRRYADAYQSYVEAYEEALALDYFDESRNRKLAFSSSGRMATACMLGKWEEADQAMAELKERYRDLKPENQKKMDYWIDTGQPRLDKREC